MLDESLFSPFIPMYFKGELFTGYQLLGDRFGEKVKMLASSLFVVMRNIADGIRLLLTAIVLAAVYTAFVPEANQNTIIIASIILLGIVMIIFTFYGGMEAVIWVEAVQLIIYIGGALAAAWIILGKIDGGMETVWGIGNEFQKFKFLDFTFSFTKTFTFWGGLIGGCFLTMSTHGTDQYLVQRYLCTDKPSAASLALLSSGAIVLGQFIGFLFIGVLLFVYYQPFNLPDYVNAGIAGSNIPATLPFAGGDQVFPDFITKHMPSGISGLVVAAAFAAALSSSLNSIAATATNDPLQTICQGPWINIFYGSEYSDGHCRGNPDCRCNRSQRRRNIRLKSGTRHCRIDQWSDFRCLFGWNFHQKSRTNSGFDRYALQHRAHAVCFFRNQNSISLVSGNRQHNNALYCLRGKFVYSKTGRCKRIIREVFMKRIFTFIFAIPFSSIDNNVICSNQKVRTFCKSMERSRKDDD